MGQHFGCDIHICMRRKASLSCSVSRFCQSALFTVGIQRGMIAKSYGLKVVAASFPRPDSRLNQAARANAKLCILGFGPFSVRIFALNEPQQNTRRWAPGESAALRISLLSKPPANHRFAKIRSQRSPKGQHLALRCSAAARLQSCSLAAFSPISMQQLAST